MATTHRDALRKRAAETSDPLAKIRTENALRMIADCLSGNIESYRFCIKDAYQNNAKEIANSAQLHEALLDGFRSLAEAAQRLKEGIIAQRPIGSSVVIPIR